MDIPFTLRYYVVISYKLSSFMQTRLMTETIEMSVPKIYKAETSYSMIPLFNHNNHRSTIPQNTL